MHIGVTVDLIGGVVVNNWSSVAPADQNSFKSDKVRIEVVFDGMPLDLQYWGFEVVDNVADKRWSYVFPDWLSGSDSLQVMIIDDDGGFVWTADVTVNGDGPGCLVETSAADRAAHAGGGIVRTPSSGTGW